MINILQKLQYLRSRLQPSVSHDYRLLTSAQARQVAKKYEDSWKDSSLPEKQYQVVKKELAAVKNGNPPLVLETGVQLVRNTGLKNPTLLEIGCSSGYYNEIFQLSGLKVSYQGCDYSDAFITFAREIYPDLDFKTCDATQLAYKNAEFDIGFSSGCILFVYNYKKAIKETARVSKKYMIFHRTPVCKKLKTSYFLKKGYGVEMVELVFNEKEFIQLCESEGFVLITHKDSNHSDLALFPDRIYHRSYLFKRNS